LLSPACGTKRAKEGRFEIAPNGGCKPPLLDYAGHRAVRILKDEGKPLKRLANEWTPVTGLKAGVSEST
jgi:hypothetical protein